MVLLYANSESSGNRCPSRFVPLLRPWPWLFLVFFSLLNLLRFHLTLYLRVSRVDLRIGGFVKSAQVHYGLFALAQKN